MKSTRSGNSHGREHEKITLELMELFMSILDRLTLATVKATAEAAEIQDLTAQVDTLQKANADLQAQIATATAGMVPVSAVEPVLAALGIPDDAPTA